MPKCYAFLTSLILLLATAHAHAETSVWRISKGDSHLYVGGTFHLLSASDHPLPDGYAQAYRKADTLVFETDLAKAQTPQFQMALMNALTFQDNRILQSTLKPETYKSLENFLNSRGLPIDNFAKFTPGGIGLMIAIMEYQRMGMQPVHGVDYIYHQKAMVDKKVVKTLETPEQQLEFISKIGEGQGDEMILYTLKEINRLSEFVNSLKTAWRDGDLKALDKLALADTRKLFPATHKSLITDRNDLWLPRINTMLADGGTEFVLVGALHLAGPEGLIAQLQKQGYKIENL